MSLKGRKHVRYRTQSGPPSGAWLPIVMGLVLLYFLFK